VVLAGSGILLGLLASVPLARVVRSFLVGVSPTDPLTFVGIPAILLGVAVLASYLPARRASTVDPVEALRDD
jgi:ABC-type antimicrobial peptide transport system permease subunit